jgi:predicted dehydrogenase
MRLRFGMIGNGTIAGRHKEAIKSINGVLRWVSDPALVTDEGKIPYCSFDQNAYMSNLPPSDWMFDLVDYIVVCSPTYLHRHHVKEALKHNKQVICEKPLCLPWEPLIDDDRINIVLQLRYIENLPKKADLVKAVMVRDEEFFKSWKGDPRKAGGNIYEFFIHYIDLAILLGANFEGAVSPKGAQERKIIYDKEYGLVQDEAEIDIMKIDMQHLYNRMYEDICCSQTGGVKPRDIFYLSWILNRNSELYGYRKGGFDRPIKISKELL